MGVLQYSRFFLLCAIAFIGIAHALSEESASEKEDVASAAQRRAYAWGWTWTKSSSLEESTRGKDDKGESQLARGNQQTWFLKMLQVSSSHLKSKCSHHHEQGIRRL
jgi:hypothetical protein